MQASSSSISSGTTTTTTNNNDSVSTLPSSTSNVDNTHMMAQPLYYGQPYGVSGLLNSQFVAPPGMMPYAFAPYGWPMQQQGWPLHQQLPFSNNDGGSMMMSHNGPFGAAGYASMPMMEQQCATNINPGDISYQLQLLQMTIAAQQLSLAQQASVVTQNNSADAFVQQGVYPSQENTSSAVISDSPSSPTNTSKNIEQSPCIINDNTLNPNTPASLITETVFSSTSPLPVTSNSNETTISSSNNVSIQNNAEMIADSKIKVADALPSDNTVAVPNPGKNSSKPAVFSWASVASQSKAPATKSEKPKVAPVQAPVSPSASSALAPAGVTTAANWIKLGYNPVGFDCNPVDARFFIIKSYNEDDVHKSIKYNAWTSTETGNKRLNKAFKESPSSCQIYLFFSVNSSGHFCGIARMLSEVDYNTTASYWQEDNKYKAEFKLKWIFVKDTPNNLFRNITNPYNDNRPVTFSRDTQEIPLLQGKQMLKIIANHKSETCLFDDFELYEKKQLERSAAKDLPVREC